MFIHCISKMTSKVFEATQSKRNTSDFDRHVRCEARRTLIPAIKRNLSDRRDDRAWLWLRMISWRERKEKETKERTTRNRCINVTSNATRQSTRPSTDVISLVDTPRQIITGASHGSLAYPLTLTLRSATPFNHIELFFHVGKFTLSFFNATFL